MALVHPDDCNIPHYVAAQISIGQAGEKKAPLSLKYTLWKALLKYCETKVARQALCEETWWVR